MKKWYENKILKKLFLTTNDWNAAWKTLDSKEFNIIENPNGYWLADTLVYETNNNNYLFVEAYEKNKSIGRLAVLSYFNDKFDNFKIILEKDYHLSYPYVFSYKGKYYLIPESSANNTIDLYIATSFPDKWKFLCNLAIGKFVDTSVIQINENDFMMYTYDLIKKQSIEGILNMESLKIKFNKFTNDYKNCLRNGGRIYYIKDKICIPFQNNKNFYGQSLKIIDKESNKIIKEIIPENIKNKDNIHFKRLHTYSKTSKFEAIDVSGYKFDFFKVIKKLVKKIWKN